MKAFFLLVSLLLATSIHAQPAVCAPEWTSKVDLDCSIGSNQEMARCLAARAGEANAEMERILNAVKNDLVKPADLQNAQHAWASYRSSECKYQTSGTSCEAGKSGAACSAAAGRCEVRLTCERVTLLRDHMGNICADCPPRKSAGR